MISDSTLYSLSIFLGSLAMLLIILYHYLEINSHDDDNEKNIEHTSPDLARLADEKTGVGAVKAAPPHPRYTGVGAGAGLDKEKDKGTMAGSMNKGGGSP